jgi:hypothetical protein
MSRIQTVPAQCVAHRYAQRIGSPRHHAV